MEIAISATGALASFASLLDAISERNVTKIILYSIFFITNLVGIVVFMSRL